MWEGPRKARPSEPTDARPQNPTTGGSKQISSGNYYLQEEWSNASSGCAQGM
jgi:hypothetical protein